MTAKTKRLLRRILAFLALGGFPLLVVVSFRPSGARTEQAHVEVAGTLLRESEGIRDRLRFEEFDYSESEGDAEVYRLRAAEAIAFAEGADRMFRLKDVTFLTRDAATGRSAVLEAPRAEFVPGTKAFRVFDGVRIEGEGVGVRSVSFRYDPGRKILVSEGPVTALHDGLVATAREGSVETGAGVVRFRGAVRVGGEDERGRRLALAAEEVDLRRGGGFAARGAVVLKTDELLLRGAAAGREPFGDGDRLSALGSVVAFLVPGTEASLESPVRAEGERLELHRDAAGVPARILLSGAPARLDVPPDADGGAPRDRERVRGHPRLWPDGARDGAGPALPPRVGGAGPTGSETPPAARLVTAGSGQLAFAADGKTVETAVFDGGVAVSEGTRTSVKAPRATLRGADESAVFAGTAEEPARYQDEKARVAAGVLTWFRRDDRIEAAGSVQTSFRGREGSELFGKGSSDSPIFSESDFLRVSPSERKILLTGNVTAWQEENVLRAQSLLLDDRERSLRAEGDVRAILRAGAGSTRGRRGTVETVTASGNVLTHREEDRLSGSRGLPASSPGPG